MSEINRRDFLKVVGVSGAASAVACDPLVPIENVLPYVVQPAQLVPGVATWLSTQCNECSAGCGVIARNREGRVVKLEGNPDHPTNRGSLCAVGQAGIQATYSPDRFASPMQGPARLDWNQALDGIAGKLQSGTKVAWLGYPRTGAVGALVESFMGALGGKPLYWDPVGDDGLRAATLAGFGEGFENRVPSYDLARAHTIVSFGSDFLATGGDVSHQRGWSDSRDPEHGRTSDEAGFVSKTICVEPRIGVSSAITDLHLAARPGSETGLALAMASALCSYEHEDVKGPGYPAGPVGDALKGVDVNASVAAADIKPESFGLAVKWLAEDLAAGHRTVVLPGGHATSTHATELAKATLLLNDILGNIKEDGTGTVRFGVGVERNVQGVGSFSEVQALMQACKDKQVDVLIVDGIDLAHVLPGSVDVASALQGPDTVVVFANEPNETANATALPAGYVLPPGSTLETWGDGEAYRGIRTLQQPAMNPLLNTRSVGQVLFALAARASLDLAGQWSWMTALVDEAAACESRGSIYAEYTALKDSVASNNAEPVDGQDPVDPADLEAKALQLSELEAANPWLSSYVAPGECADPDVPTAEDYENAEAHENYYSRYIQRYWAETVYSGDDAGFEAFWIECLQRGGLFDAAVPTGAKLNLSALPVAGDAPGQGTFLVLFPHPFLMDGRHANKPWAQEVPEPISSHTWGTWIEIHPDVAAEKGLEKGTLVKVTVGGQTLTCAWFGSPGIRKDTIAMVMGNGHEQGRYAKVGGKGNPVHLLAGVADTEGGALSYVVDAGVDVSADGGETSVNAYIGNIDQDGRPINFVVSHDDLGRGVEREAHGHGNSIVPVHHVPYPGRLEKADIFDMFPEPEHPTHRFAMAIDLNRCTGCNACSTACFAENNLPVVGPDQMRKSRYMGWIRLSRYWEGEGDTPDVRFQPVMCQQCSHAPCEGVCPVLATYHNLDGLNAMIYNRCVGTRYCANNCPYSARRFNFHSYEWPESFNLMLNPDVSTREMGIMEKCTFCVQRIRDVKEEQRGGLSVDQLGERGEGGLPYTRVPEERLTKLTACAQACPSDALTFGNLRWEKDETDGEEYAGTVYSKFSSERAYTMLGELNTKPGVKYLARISHGPSKLDWDETGSSHAGAGHESESADASHEAGAESGH